MNIGHHHIGCRGYEGKKPKWDKEDQAYIEQGIENPYDRYEETETGKLVTNPIVVQGVVFRTDLKVVKVKKVVASNL
jgi:hypothetical protein